jgi:maltose O-acetyltransferase
MQTLAPYLWQHRERLPFGSQEWILSWAKRIQLLPAFFRQGRIHRRLRCRGAKISGSAIFADDYGIAGRVEKLSVGEHSFVGRAELALHDRISIGRCVCVNDGAKLLTASHDAMDPGWRTLSSPIVVEDYAWIATNAIVLPGVSIGRGAIVGAGAVVAKDVLPFTIVVGNPAQALERARVENLDYRPTEFVSLLRAWNSSRSRLRSR